MDAAEDGDTIVLKNQIDILENCIIGSEEKTITLAPAEDFSGDALISLWAYDQQEITIKNLLLDGKSYPQVSAMITNFADTSAEVRGTIHLENMMVSNFSSWRSTVLVSSLSAVIDGCRFMNNQSNRTAGIEIAPNATAEILGCEFFGNTSKGNGGAIYCRGQAVITNSIIENNTALNVDTAVRNGGGVYVDENASCKITACKITKNVSDLGGGISVYGNTNITDTFLCGNQGTKGASDIKATSGVQLEVNYSDGMQTIYTENDPIGFYVDDFENPFDAENHAVLLGETINGTITNGQFGAKFILLVTYQRKPHRQRIQTLSRQKSRPLTMRKIMNPLTVRTMVHPALPIRLALPAPLIRSHLQASLITHPNWNWCVARQFWTRKSPCPLLDMVTVYYMNKPPSQGHKLPFCSIVP